MTDLPLEPSTRRGQRQRALARWDSEGGAGPDGPQTRDVSGVFSSNTIGKLDAERAEPRLPVTAQGSADQVASAKAVVLTAQAPQADGHAGSSAGLKVGETAKIRT